MTETHFCVSWDSNKTISKGLSRLQQNGEFVDMTLAADGYLVKVHQNIVALASPYLKSMVQFASCQHPVVFLNNISHQTLTFILEYIYTGEVKVPADVITVFINACKSLCITGVEDFVLPTSKETQPLTDQLDPTITRSVEPQDNKKFAAHITINSDNFNVEVTPMDNNIIQSITNPIIPVENVEVDNNIIQTAMHPFIPVENVEVDNNIIQTAMHPFIPVENVEVDNNMIQTAKHPIIPVDNVEVDNSIIQTAMHPFIPVENVEVDNNIIQTAMHPIIPVDNVEVDNNIIQTAMHPFIPVQNVAVDNNIIQTAMHPIIPFENVEIENIFQRAAINDAYSTEHEKTPIVIPIGDNVMRFQPVLDNVEKIKTHITSNSNFPNKRKHQSKKFAVPPSLGEKDKIQHYSISNRGSLQLLLNRYMYHCHHQSYGGRKRRWRCIDYRKLNCRAFIDTNEDNITQRSEVHTHSFHDAKILGKFKSKSVFTSLIQAEDQATTVKENPPRGNRSNK